MPAPLAPLIAARRAKPIVPLWDRFWSQVDMRAGITGCWPWRGARSTNHKRKKGDRGVIQLGSRGSRVLKAHRLALCFAGEGVGEYDCDLVAAHRCGNRLCCNNYSHLYWATPEENVEDRLWEESREVCVIHISGLDLLPYDDWTAQHEFRELVERIG